jgi:hypothetical protein
VSSDVHGLVKDPHDLDALVGTAIEDQVAIDPQLPKASTDFVAGLAQFRQVARAPIHNSCALGSIRTPARFAHSQVRLLLAPQGMSSP